MVGEVCFCRVNRGVVDPWQQSTGALGGERDSKEDLPAVDEAGAGAGPSGDVRKCGSLENLQVHHKIKRSQMGTHSLDNLVTLCAYCHMGEHGQLFYSAPAVSVCTKPKPRRN